MSERAGITPDREAPPAVACLNCGHQLHGRYCSECGQKRTEPDPRLRELAHEAADELLHWDGKLVRTLGALFRRPGFLTREYLAGRRARFVSPVKLYLTASVVYFAVLAVVPRMTAVRFDVGDTTPAASGATAPAPVQVRPPSGAFRTKKRQAFDRIARDPERFRQALRHNQPKAMFVLLPLFALGLRALYRRQGRYPAHFVFALHLHAFAFLVLAATTAPSILSASLDGVDALGIVTSCIYLVLALRRTYGEPWGRTFLKAGTLAVLYLFAFAFTLIGLIGLTALTL